MDIGDRFADLRIRRRGEPVRPLARGRIRIRPNRLNEEDVREPGDDRLGAGFAQSRFGDDEVKSRSEPVDHFAISSCLSRRRGKLKEGRQNFQQGMALVVFEDKRPADKIRDFAATLDLVFPVRSWRVAPQPFLKVYDFRPRRIRDFTRALFRNDDEIAGLQATADIQLLNYKKGRPFGQNEKRRADLFRNIKPPRRADLDRAIDRAADTNAVQDFG